MATITKRGDTYTIRVSAGYGLDGKQIRRNLSWTPLPGMSAKQIDKELDRQMVLFEERVKTGRVIDGNIKFADFADIWIADHAEKQLEPKTVHRYKEMLSRIKGSIGHIRLDRLQPNHLMAFYNLLAANNIRTDTRYKSRVDLRSVIRGAGLTYIALATQTGLSVGTVRSAVRGENTTSGSAKKICEGLSLKLADAFEPIDKNAVLSDSTILHHHRLISSILNTAVEWQIIFANPAERVKSPRVNRVEANYLDEDQVKRLIQSLESEPIIYRTIIILLIYSGLRRGELCGLKWSDIDFDKNLINICRAMQYLPGRGIFETTTKSKTSIRVIKLSTIAFKLLKDYKAWQTGERLRVGDVWEDNNFVFTRWNGKPIHPDTVTGWFSSFVKRSDMSDVSIHSLRHTNATLMIAGGTDIRTVSHRLGHAQTSTTSNIYAHAIRSADEAAADTIENLLTPTQNSKEKRPI